MNLKQQLQDMTKEELLNLITRVDEIRANPLMLDDEGVRLQLRGEFTFCLAAIDYLLGVKKGDIFLCDMLAAMKMTLVSAKQYMEEKRNERS